MFEGKEMLDRFNVEIKFNKTRYQATSDVFTSCVGYGKTQEEALDQLGISIGNFLGQISKKTIRGLFSQNAYTEVLIEGKDKATPQKRVYTFGQTNVTRKFLGIKPLSTQHLMSYDAPNINSIEFDSNQIHTHQTHRPTIESDTLNMTQLLSDDMSQQPDDTIILGFPLNMN